MVELEDGWLAFGGSGFTDANGRSVRQFDRIEHESGRMGVMLDATHDGDAYIILSGSSRVQIVKWRSICKVPSSDADDRITELEARANEYAAEAQRMTEAADKDTWRANAAEIARDEAIARAEKAEKEAAEIQDVIADQDEVIDALRKELRLANKELRRSSDELARLRAEGTFNEGIEAAVAHMTATVGSDHGLRARLRRPETGGS